MLMVFELIVILLLAATLFMILKADGITAKARLRRAKLDDCWTGKERRNNPRFIKSLEVSYSIVKKKLPEKTVGKTADISEGGARLVLDEKLAVGTLLNLKISLPGLDQEAEIAGDVVWTEDAEDIKEPIGKRYFHSGIKFSSIEDPSSKYFIDYIRSLV